jgi:hypothetical protein
MARVNNASFCAAAGPATTVAPANTANSRRVMLAMVI